MKKKLVKIGEQYGLIIEASILELLEIDKETVLNVRTDGVRLIIEPIAMDEQKVRSIESVESVESVELESEEQSPVLGTSEQSDDDYTGFSKETKMIDLNDIAKMDVFEKSRESVKALKKKSSKFSKFKKSSLVKRPLRKKKKRAKIYSEQEYIEDDSEFSLSIDNEKDEKLSSEEQMPTNVGILSSKSKSASDDVESVDYPSIDLGGAEEHVSGNNDETSLGRPTSRKSFSEKSSKEMSLGDLSLAEIDSEESVLSNDKDCTAAAAYSVESKNIESLSEADLSEFDHSNMTEDAYQKGEKRNILVSFSLKGEKVLDLPLNKQKMVIGRDSESDIYLDHRSLSRRHAQFELREGVLWLIDLKSANGVYYNGEKITEPQRIKEGSVVGLGLYRITFQGLSQPKINSPVMYLKGPDIKQRFALEGKEVIVGRSSSCDVAINHKGISRKHLKISVRKRYFLVEDLGSQNGYSVNGEETKGIKKVYPGDLLKLAEYTIRLQMGGEEKFMEEDWTFAVLSND